MKATASYRQHQVFSAPNEQVLVLLLEKVLEKLESARAAMTKGGSGSRVQWCQDLGRVRAILVELRSALDHDVAPELSGALESTYTWILGRLSDIGRSGDPAEVETLLRATRPLYEGFSAAIAAAEPSERGAG